ncbi:MAG: 50S ribosomal protein L24 [Candidatus Omnitrophica bacterium]|nr:50S ribosomal protein L24 [Candidatus Omnitrophota bacterium]
MKIRKNDSVICQAGKDKGKKGKVLTILPKTQRAIVEGINFAKRHTRRTREEQQGGIIQKEAPIDISNLSLICSKCNKVTRVAYSFLKDASKVRICRKCKEVIG